MKKILFVTTSNITTNPRLVKEAMIASANGYLVEILCFKYKGWSEQLDIQWMAKNQHIHVHKITTLLEKNALWMLASFLERVCQFFYSFFPKSILVNAYASAKRSFLLKRAIFSKAQNLHQSYNIILAHNLGALYPVWCYQQLTGIPFVFDVEDYYPGEHISSDVVNEKQRREFLIQKMLPFATCVTVASPLIGERMKTLVGEKGIKNMLLINNCFPSDEFEYTEPADFRQGTSDKRKEAPSFTPHASHPTPYAPCLTPHKVQFVWFSQNIAANRGLELIIPELARVSKNAHLHLIGNLYDDFNRQWIDPYREFVSSYPPMTQKDLNRFVCQFDVGLALEIPSVDENRQICLTNKIWEYLQAGLYILATDTPAQVGFMKEHEGHGMTFEISTLRSKVLENTVSDSIVSSLKYIINNIEIIRQEKKDRFVRANEYSWENEGHKLQQIWDQIKTVL